MSNPFAEDTEHISVAIALGAEVEAIPGSIFYEVSESGGRWDMAYERAVGYFSEEIGAKNYALKLMYQYVETSVSGDTPWGSRPSSSEGGVDAEDSWHVGRQEWFETHSYEEIVEWFNDLPYDDFNEEAQFKIVKHTISFTEPAIYNLPRNL